jgi:hypothetical protein
MLSSNKDEPNTRVDGAMGQAAQFQQLVPGASETVRFGVPVLVKNNHLDLSDKQFSLDVSLIYNDGLHPGDKVENRTVCGLKPNNQGGGLVTLYYCVDFIGEFHQPGGH